MNNADTIRDIRADLIKTYLSAMGCDYVTTELVKDVWLEYFTHWDLTDKDIAYFVDRIHNVR